MADHNPQHSRRQHFHRGRRGPDRRGVERRSTQTAAPEHGGRETARDTGGVDVEQIMRDIRSRIAQRHGIELTNPQIQELASRRLDAILEPRNIKPQLLEQLRKSAGSAPDIPEAPSLDTYTFEETTLYETHRGLLRLFRKLLNPILKLFFNPAPLIAALHTQTRVNKALIARDAERDRRQAEWNALHYELVQRVVTETARLSIEMQALNARIESLSAKVDFNERRVRSLETIPPANTRPPQPRPAEALPVAAPADTAAAAAGGEQTTDSARRRRRRRRGRRGSGGVSETNGPPEAAAVGELEDVDGGDAGELDEEEAAMPGGADLAGAPPVAESAAAAPEPPPAPAPPAVEPAPFTAPVELTHEPHAVPSPPPDEPRPDNPVDRADPGPEDR
jgi:hypothetical protein